MAFLLAATMVVGSATSASAMTANIKIIGVKGGATEKTNATFDAQITWDFKGDTNINRYTAALSSSPSNPYLRISPQMSQSPPPCHSPQSYYHPKFP